jgi:hypothetical protein
MGIDPIFLCFLSGVIVCIGILSDELLSFDVHAASFGVLFLYIGALIFLYWPGLCDPTIRICQIAFGLRDDLSRWQGGDPATLFLILSGFISFTVDLTGTKSLRWQNIGAYMLIPFWFFFVIEFFSQRLDFLSSLAIFVLGVAFIFLKVVRRRKRKKKIIERL